MVAGVVFSHALPGWAVVVAMAPLCPRGKRWCPVEILWCRPLCVQFDSIRGFLPSTDRPPRPQRELSSLQAVDFFQQVHRLSREHHVAVAAGRRRRLFALRALWLVPFDIGVELIPS